MKNDTRPLQRRVHRLPREQRMADIMEMARIVFCEKGYTEAVISEIAQRLGVVEGTIYRYFPSKRDLLIDVASDWYEQMLSDYDQQLKGVRGTWNRLRFMVWRHLTVIRDDPAMCRLVMGELRVWPEYRKTPIYELNRAYTQCTLAIIEEGIASGEFCPDVPLQIVRDMIYGGVEHHTWAFLRGAADFSPDEAADNIVNIIYRGLINPASTSDVAGANGQAIHRLEEVAKRLEQIVESSGTA